MAGVTPVAELLPAELPVGESLEFGEYLGQQFVIVRAEAVIAVLTALKHKLQFDFLVDVTAVDYPKRAERFDLIYVLYSFSANQRIRVKTRINEGMRPASATDIFKGANWLEREVYDMFGIEFAGHPNLKRILLPEEWTGFPLRKDYSIIRQDQAWVRENLGIESGQ
jgi:NADH-quinone oxidoreductase subunit C